MSTMSIFSARRASSSGSALRGFAIALMIGLAGALVATSAADARLGGGGSFGSRGSRTFSMPSATPTAPRTSPFQRSATPNPGVFGSGLGRSPSIFGGGFGRGLLGGFLGAGLFGLLFGHGLFGGLGGGMSLIGLLLQIGLLYLIARFAIGLFAARRSASYGGGSFPGGIPGTSGYGGNQYGGMGAPGTGVGQAATTPIQIGPADYQAFEARLAESQAAYSNGDVGTLRRITTPEMSESFEQELRENDRRGVVNRIGDVRLLQGDLSEAWQENGSDYATVAMRFSLVDATLDKASGRVVAGDPQHPQEVTEVWTFRRSSGAGPQGWTLSAIQQT